MSNIEDLVNIHNLIVDLDSDVSENVLCGYYQDLETTLKLARQKAERLRREMESSTDTQLWRKLGEYEGKIDAYFDSYRRTIIEKRIFDTQLSVGDYFRKIVIAIYSDHGIGIRHRKLAEKIGVSYNRLTELMKEMLGNRIVSSAGYGESTRYMLEDSTKYYCIKHGIIEDTKEKINN